MNAPNPSNFALVLLLPLIAWRVYARLRRMVGRQRLSRVRPWITLAVFSVLVLMLALASLPRPEVLSWLAGGLLAGSMLAAYGLKLTRFEPTPGGLYYTPNLHLGIALSLLFVGRIVYRMVEIHALEANGVQVPSDFARSPLTLAVFGLLAGYYIGYAIGLVRWRARVIRAKMQREAGAGNP